MIVVSNVIKSGRAANASSHGGDFHFRLNAGDVCEVAFRVNALSGSPTTASLAIKWQFAPLFLSGLDEDTVSSVAARRWFDVLKTDPRWTDYFVNEDGTPTSDWPATIVDQTQTAEISAGGVYVSRKIKIPSMFLVRTVMTRSFSGGTSPFFTYSQWQTQYSKLGGPR